MKDEEIDATTHVIELGGEEISTAKFEERFGELIESGKKRIVVDLSPATLTDETSLGVLVRGVKRLRPAGGSLVLVCTDDNIRRIFAVTGLDRVFPTYGSRAEAIEALRPGSAPNKISDVERHGTVSGSRDEAVADPGMHGSQAVAKNSRGGGLGGGQRRTATADRPRTQAGDPHMVANADEARSKGDAAPDGPPPEEADRYEAAQRSWRWTRSTDDAVYTGLAVMDASGHVLARGTRARMPEHAEYDEDRPNIDHRLLLRALPGEGRGATLSEVEAALGMARDRWYQALVREVERGNAVLTDGGYLRTGSEPLPSFPDPDAKNYDWETELDDVVRQALAAEDRREARRLLTRLRRAWAALVGDEEPSLRRLSGRSARALAKRHERDRTGVFAPDFQAGWPFTSRASTRRLQEEQERERQDELRAARMEAHRTRQERRKRDEERAHEEERHRERMRALMGAQAEAIRLRRERLAQIGPLRLTPESVLRIGARTLPVPSWDVLVEAVEAEASVIAAECCPSKMLRPAFAWRCTREALSELEESDKHIDRRGVGWALHGAR